ncbi:hypothetical protein K2X40_05355 [Candidatus Babeliales bacterium]|nr:hypothetical protein [Candidatus Babeliales bacterium]
MKKHHGSALLLVLGITSMLSILMLLHWQRTSLLFDLVHERDKYQAQQRTLQNFFVAATNFVNKHHQRLVVSVTSKKPLRFNLEQQVSLSDNQLVRGVLTLYKDDVNQCLRMMVQLVEDNKVTLGMRCVVKKQPTVRGEKLAVSHVSVCSVA